MYTHIHVRKEKMALNRTVIIASQIAQVCHDIELCGRSLIVANCFHFTVKIHGILWRSRPPKIAPPSPVSKCLRLTKER